MALPGPLLSSQLTPAPSLVRVPAGGARGRLASAYQENILRWSRPHLGAAGTAMPQTWTTGDGT